MTESNFAETLQRLTSANSDAYVWAPLFRQLEDEVLSNSARKATGNYYTPECLTRVLLDGALEPVIQKTISANKRGAAEALLNLTIVDTACGSGRILIAAARRIARHVALQRRADPSVAEYRLALRQVTERCVFGVDQSPMAAALCSAALGMEKSDRETHIRHGNSLLWIPSDAPQSVRVKLPGEAFHWHLEFPRVFNSGGFDVVLGNPPFINAIEGGVDVALKTFLSAAMPELTGTADMAYRFVLLAHRIAKPTGAVGLIQPKGFLIADSASELRATLAAHRPLTLLYIPSSGNLFQNASVQVCVIALQHSGVDCSVSDTNPPAVPEWRLGKVDDVNWWRASQRILGKIEPSKTVERFPLDEHFELTASMTAGEAYEIKPFVVDSKSSRSLRLITTGLIDPGVCLWGQSSCRYLGKDYGCPTIKDVDDIPKSVSRRLAKARRPKVLVAGLCKRLEAFFDTSGACIGAVSTLSIFHAKDDAEALARLCVWLHSDEATEQVRVQLGATSMNGGYMTLKKGVMQKLKVPNTVVSRKVDNNGNKLARPGTGR